MNEKVPIELSSYSALELLSFIEEFKDDFSKREDCKSIVKVFKEYSDQVYLKITNDQIDDAKKEREINNALGYTPNQ